MHTILSVEGLTLSFGGLNALNDLSFEVFESEFLAIIGPNGAGKSALLNCISGFYRAQYGEITFDGKVLTRLPVHKVVKQGIARTFQHPRLCPDLTVLDNIIAGMHLFAKENTLAQMFWFGPALKEEIRLRHKAEELLSLLRMGSLGRTKTGSLPHGLRKKVELIRALALQPRLLLLDEPMSGMSVEEKGELTAFLLDIHRLQKIPIILVEHDMRIIMDIAERVIVLNFGTKIAEGSPLEIVRNTDVVKAYLGMEYEERNE